ncbi:pentapeptide repeat-containing protein [Tellurirhabdus rosea]|uniref:pentapeptide repeat-containing protein n=1 Tax=Tellurirhabdus rosea TaxID=2674997 RepID=UPI002250F3D3|nr:pentapeptide repeat-containing protein [Tellurirhabdus rosea]
MEYYNQVFGPGTDLPGQWAQQDFEQCTFRKLELTGVSLSGANFTDCHFEECNLTRIQLKNTKLDDAVFTGCNLSHVDFGVVNAFGFRVSFRECKLDYTVFLNRNLKKTRFDDCSLREAHFLKCDMVGVVFNNCNLELARFGENNLSQADFSTSYNLRMDPDDNRLRKAKFSIHSLPGLLEKYDLVVKTGE